MSTGAADRLRTLLQWLLCGAAVGVLCGGASALFLWMLDGATAFREAHDALVHALDRAPALAGRALVVTNGEPRTVAEMVERILRAAGFMSR